MTEKKRLIDAALQNDGARWWCCACYGTNFPNIDDSGETLPVQHVVGCALVASDAEAAALRLQVETAERERDEAVSQREVASSIYRAKIVRQADAIRRAEAAEAELSAARAALAWALGESGDFAPRPEGGGAYWWRTELRSRANAALAPAVPSPMSDARLGLMMSKIMDPPKCATCGGSGIVMRDSGESSALGDAVPLVPRRFQCLT